MAEWLENQTDLNVAAYHAGVALIERFRIQNQFMNNELQVICATSAFGMGIDKMIFVTLFITICQVI